VIREAAAAVEFNGGVAVGDFEVEKFGAVFARGGLGEVKKLGANSLSAMGGFDEEFVNPRAFAAIFEAVVEANHQIADQRVSFPNKIDDAVDRILQKLGEIGANRGFLKRLRPGIVLLHVEHHREQGFDICGSGTGNGDGHGTQSRLCRKNEVGEQNHTTAGKLAVSANGLPGKWEGAASHGEEDY